MLRDRIEDSQIDYASVFLSREASHPENPFMEVDYTQNGSETDVTTDPQELTETHLERGILLLPAIILLGTILLAIRKRIPRNDVSGYVLGITKQP